jgi:hypothetical protein
MVHTIDEYARHNEHADLLRERIAGATGGRVDGDGLTRMNERSSRRVMHRSDCRQYLLDRGQSFSFGRVPDVPNDPLGVDNKCAASRDPRKQSIGSERNTVCGGKLASKVADERILNVQLFCPGTMRIRTIDTDRSDLEPCTTKLVVCVPKLGHLVRSTAGEVERVGRKDDPLLPIQQRIQRGFDDLATRG